MIDIILGSVLVIFNIDESAMCVVVVDNHCIDYQISEFE